jgi:hypothetical protein
MTNQGDWKICKPNWEVRAEMTALIPVWLDLAITLLECDSRGVLPKDS